MDAPAEEFEGGEFRAIVDSLPDLIYRSTLDGRLLYVNASYAAFHGTTPEALIGTNLLDPLEPETRLRVERHFAELIHSSGETRFRVNQSRVINAAGEVEWHEWTDTVVFRGDTAVNIFGVGRDVTSRVEAERQVQYLASHDPLTGLLNRRSTSEALGIRLDEHRFRPESVGVVFGDVDGLKMINDRFGHRAGDEAIVSVARLMRACVRESDAVGRIGGDEFVIIVVRNTGLVDAVERICARISDALGEDPTLPSVSLGHAIAQDGDTPSDLFARADARMYHQKRSRLAS